MKEGGGAECESLRRRRELFGAVASIVLIVTVLVLAIVGSQADDPPPLQEVARIVDAPEIEDVEATLGHPVYWAGVRADERLELKVEGDGSVYLRYLPAGTEVGDPRQEFLTVGTYSVPEAQAALQQTALESGTRVEHLADGSVALPSSASAGSVYLAYPDSDLEIEVYDPQPGQALELIHAGAIEPVGG